MDSMCTVTNLHFTSLTRLLLFLVCFLAISKCQDWVIEDDGCRTPDGGTGNCEPIKECQPMVEFLNNAKRPLSQTAVDRLNSYTCSFASNQVWVCCPPGPIVLDNQPTRPTTVPNTNEVAGPPDVTQHRNYNLLPTECGYLNSQDKIRNGVNASLNEFPWMALLSYRTRQGPQFKCGGTIINDRYILTAAHCISNINDPLLGVRVGEHNILTRTDCELMPNGRRKCSGPVQDLAIEEIIPHPRFNADVIENDIGLLRVSRINLNVENARPVCLPVDNSRDATFKYVTVTGWGVTDSGQNSMVLQKVELPVVSLRDCQNVYRSETKASITNRQVCAGGRDKKDSCPGDSGGPLHVAAFINDETRYVQQGIVSFGPRFCGLEGYPGVYTRVAYYMDWILDTIRPNAEENELVPTEPTETHGTGTTEDWVLGDDGCKTPDAVTGNCLPIKKCRPMVDFLYNTRKPLSQTTVHRLNLYVCSFVSNQVWVCCPPGPILLENQPTRPTTVTVPNTNEVAGPPDVNYHKNYNLLPTECGYLNSQDKIRNGVNASLNEFPWMALLSYRTRRGPQFKCGGTIINDRYILTAAHCISNINDPLLGVRVGEHNILTRTDCELMPNGRRKCSGPVQDLAIEEIIPHPRFNVDVIKNDIGLLRVSPINLNVENARPVCLPVDDSRDATFKYVTVTGWGITDSGQSSMVLQKVDLPVVSLEDCQNVYRSETKASITNRQVCAGGRDKKDSCAGDSGGPLHVAAFINDETRYVQQGIVSFGPRFCGLEGYPGVYTRVAYYMDWILDTIRR